jgi:hypothetical protein
MIRDSIPTDHAASAPPREWHDTPGCYVGSWKTADGAVPISMETGISRVADHRHLRRLEVAVWAENNAQGADQVGSVVAFQALLYDIDPRRDHLAEMVATVDATHAGSMRTASSLLVQDGFPQVEAVLWLHQIAVFNDVPDRFRVRALHELRDATFPLRSLVVVFPGRHTIPGRGVSKQRRFFLETDLGFRSIRTADSGPMYALWDASRLQFEQ